SCGECNWQIYAIYFHFAGVGRGSDQKNSEKIIIILLTLAKNGALKNLPRSKNTYLLGFLRIFEK
ncbi:MAG TPA: hypothetical protein VG347_18320, partial [Verrucomicrobiae bacterium]|nr:hypothetical protein [Verrucomicrobiae bacterium]